ncbi:MAG: RNA polymerase sigma factor [Cryomorphaceae bacterium]
MQSETELNLIKRAAEGEHRAFRLLVEEHHLNVFNLVQRIVQQRELAEEVAQDVFLKAFRSLHRFKGTARFSTWLYRIAYNEAISNSRKKKFSFESLNETNVSSETATMQAEEVGGVEEDRLEQLELAIAELNADSQALLTMYYQQNQSVKAIGEIIGESESNVKVRLFRIRKQILATIAAVPQQP